MTLFSQHMIVPHFNRLLLNWLYCGRYCTISNLFQLIDVISDLTCDLRPYIWYRFIIWSFQHGNFPHIIQIPKEVFIPKAQKRLLSLLFSIHFWFMGRKRDHYSKIKSKKLWLIKLFRFSQKACKSQLNRWAEWCSRSEYNYISYILQSSIFANELCS